MPQQFYSKTFILFSPSGFKLGLSFILSWFVPVSMLIYLFYIWAFVFSTICGRLSFLHSVNFAWGIFWDLLFYLHIPLSVLTLVLPSDSCWCRVSLKLVMVIPIQFVLIKVCFGSEDWISGHSHFRHVFMLIYRRALVVLLIRCFFLCYMYTCYVVYIRSQGWPFGIW